MSAIFAIARYTLIEQLRNRLYLIILFFGALMLGASMLLGALAPSHGVRVIFDVGLVSLEVFGLITAVFGAVTLVLQEIESKTIYLLLTRPLPRSSYILGRFLGLVIAVAVTMLIMAVLHVAIMLFQGTSFATFTEGWSFWTIYPLIILLSMGKMLITTAVALCFSLFATSSVSALVFTGCFWVAGHFSSELAFMIKKSFSGFGAQAVQLISSVFPNYQYFNLRDLYAAPGFSVFEFLGPALVYGLAYTAFFLTLSTILFSRKEF